MTSRCTRGRHPGTGLALALAAGVLSLVAAGCPAGPSLYDRHLSRSYLSKKPLAVRIADLDGDGRPDVLTVNAAQQAISLFWNTGAGTLSTEKIIDLVTPEEVVGAQVADVTGDGKPDLVTLLSQGVAILANQGDRGFAVPAVGGRVAPCTGCSALVVGDFDGDGTPDLYVAAGAKAALWPGPGYTTAASPAPPALLAPPMPVRAHLDAGKTDDILGLRQGANGPEVVALLGQATGGFVVQVAPPPPAGDVIDTLAAADLNGDGLDDAVVAGLGFIGVYLRTASGFAPLRLHIVSVFDPLSLGVADVDGDGHPDLLVGTTNGQLRTFIGDGPLTYVEAQSVAVGASPVGLAAADLDADGYADVATATQGVCCPQAYAGFEVQFGGRFTGSTGSFTLTAP